MKLPRMIEYFLEEIQIIGKLWSSSLSLSTLHGQEIWRRRNRDTTLMDVLRSHDIPFQNCCLRELSQSVTVAVI